MSTTRQLSKFPPFPNDAPILKLPRLSFIKLTGNDDAESQQLYQACREIGFFLLDLRCSNEGEVMLTDVEAIFALNQKIHELDQEELMQHAFKPPKDLFGYVVLYTLSCLTNPIAERASLTRYKRIGEMKLEDGSPDCIEFYSIAQDDVLGTASPRSHPKVILDSHGILEVFFNHAFGIIGKLLLHLDKHLALSPGTLASLSPQEKASGTSLRMLRCLPQAVGSVRTNLAGHTDMGSITMLFNTVGGLQILPFGSINTNANWRYVRPEPGCALINLGDAMVQWSGGLLRSSLHRVVTPPGDQAGCTRYSIAYLIRPEGNVSMERLGGPVIPQSTEEVSDEELCARDWEVMRAKQIMMGKNKPTSTGGTAHQSSMAGKQNNECS